MPSLLLIPSLTLPPTGESRAPIARTVTVGNMAEVNATTNPMVVHRVRARSVRRKVALPAMITGLVAVVEVATRAVRDGAAVATDAADLSG